MNSRTEAMFNNDSEYPYLVNGLWYDVLPDFTNPGDLLTDQFEAAKTFYQRKEEMLGSELMGKLERFAVLSVIDEKWKEHLREMDDMKEGIGLRAYGQKDPLIEYKQEGYRLFVTMLNEIRNNILSFCFKFFPQAPEEMQRRNRPVQRMQTIKDEVTGLV